MRTQLEYYFLLFFISAVLGWLMEVTCKLFEFRRFINRGMLIGPYCRFTASARCCSQPRFRRFPTSRCRRF